MERNMKNKFLGTSISLYKIWKEEFSKHKNPFIKCIKKLYKTGEKDETINEYNVFICKINRIKENKINCDRVFELNEKIHATKKRKFETLE